MRKGASAILGSKGVCGAVNGAKREGILRRGGSIEVVLWLEVCTGVGRKGSRGVAREETVEEEDGTKKKDDDEPDGVGDTEGA